MLLEINNDYIPLVLEQTGKIITYIIDNHVIGSKRYEGVFTYPYRAYSLLLELATHEQIWRAIPNELLSILDAKIKTPPYFSKDYLIGEMDNQFGSYCLTLDMVLDESTSQTIQLRNIQYLQGTEKITLPYEPKMNPIQAFFTFANILTNNRCNLYQHLLKEFHRADFEQLHVQEDIVDFERGRLQRFGKIYSDLNEFSYYYLKFLKKNLEKQVISPEALLYTSGSRTLAFLSYLPIVASFLKEVNNELKSANLTYHQRILYHTFRSSLSREFSEDWKKYHDEDVFFLTLFEQNVAKEFPKLTK